MDGEDQRFGPPQRRPDVRGAGQGRGPGGPRRPPQDRRPQDRPAPDRKPSSPRAESADGPRQGAPGPRREPGTPPGPGNRPAPNRRPAAASQPAPDAKTAMVGNEPKTSLVGGAAKTSVVRGEPRTSLVNADPKTSLVGGDEKTALVGDEEHDSLLSQLETIASKPQVKLAGRVATALLSAVVLIACGIVWATYRNLANGLNTSDALNDGPKSAGTSMNILLIGLDSRKDQNGEMLPKAILDQLKAGDGTEGGYNTNTLILMHIPADGSKATAFSIPRDDNVDIPGEHKDKIKKAYGYAKDKAEQKLQAQGINDRPTLEKQSRDAGRKATLQVVRNLTGVPIDHFAEVNLAGFFDLASALGGVDVCLKHPVQDHYSGANFPAGRQTLNGSQALSFVRQRHGLTNGDLDRTHRQQAFLASVATKLRSAGTFTNPTKLTDLIGVAKKDVVIDSSWDILSFAQQSQGLSGGNMDFQTLPIEGFAKNDNGEDINVIDPAKIKTIVTQAFGVADSSGSSSSSASPQAATTVDVENASGTTGLASKVADALAAQGYTKGDVSNASKNSTHSSVAYGGSSGDKVEADKIAQLLGGLTVTTDKSLSSGHIRITLGTRFTMPSNVSGSGTTPQGFLDSADIHQAPPATPTTTDPPSGPNGTGVQGSDIPCVE